MIKSKGLLLVLTFTCLRLAAQQEDEPKYTDDHRLMLPQQNGAVDGTFVQFYPTLVPIAKTKGTFQEQGAK